MRNQTAFQMLLGQTSVEKLILDLKCRDDIPAILMGLKALYLDPTLRARVLKILEKGIAKSASLAHGRPGMDLWWQILGIGVFGGFTLRHSVGF
jgi:hypothetical protein